MQGLEDLLDTGKFHVLQPFLQAEILMVQDGLHCFPDTPGVHPVLECLNKDTECGLQDPVMAEDDPIGIGPSSLIDTDDAAEVSDAFLLPFLRHPRFDKSLLDGCGEYRTPYFPISEERAVFVEDDALDAHINQHMQKNGFWLHSPYGQESIGDHRPLKKAFGRAP